MLADSSNKWWLRCLYFSIWMHFRDTLRYSSAFTARKRSKSAQFCFSVTPMKWSVDIELWTFKNKLFTLIFSVSFIRWIIEKPVIHQKTCSMWNKASFFFFRATVVQTQSKHLPFVFFLCIFYLYFHWLRKACVAPCILYNNFVTQRCRKVRYCAEMSELWHFFYRVN